MSKKTIYLVHQNGTSLLLASFDNKEDAENYITTCSVEFLEIIEIDYYFR